MIQIGVQSTASRRQAFRNLSDRAVDAAGRKRGFSSAMAEVQQLGKSTLLHAPFFPAGGNAEPGQSGEERSCREWEVRRQAPGRGMDQA